MSHGGQHEKGKEKKVKMCEKRKKGKIKGKLVLEEKNECKKGVEKMFSEDADIQTPVLFCVNLSIRTARVSNLFAHYP
jgi:hypothetical protein